MAEAWSGILICSSLPDASQHEGTQAAEPSSDKKHLLKLCLSCLALDLIQHHCQTPQKAVKAWALYCGHWAIIQCPLSFWASFLTEYDNLWHCRFTTWWWKAGLWNNFLFICALTRDEIQCFIIPQAIMETCQYTSLQSALGRAGSTWRVSPLLHDPDLNQHSKNNILHACTIAIIRRKPMQTDAETDAELCQFHIRY